MKRSSINYLLCYVNIVCAIVGAKVHDLTLMLIAFFLAVFNWYVAKALQAREENEENNNRESDDSDRTRDDYPDEE